MVIGASTHRHKYGNKAVRAYQRQNHEVLAVHPTADSIEGAPAYAEVRDVPGPIDRATLYLAPEKSLPLLDQLAQRGDVGELWLNPGTESADLIEKARGLGLHVKQGCSITAIGVTT